MPQNRPTLAAGQRFEIVAKPISLTEYQGDITEVVVTGYEAHPEVPSLEWPPPKPSTQCDLPAAFLTGAKKLKDVDARLAASLERAGYSYLSYYTIPDGFALVTQLEQTTDEAYPRPEPDRWSEDMPQTRKLSDWLRNAFIANKGHYRLLVFTVTPRAFVPTTKKLTKKQAGLWLASGLSALPEFIGKRAYTPTCKVTVLVYEYLQKEGEEQAAQVLPSLFSAPTHLSRAGIKP